MFDVVRLGRALHGLAAGAEGTIVMAYQYPREGYEVEFSDLKAPMPTLTLHPEDLELLVPADAAGCSDGPGGPDA